MSGSLTVRIKTIDESTFPVTVPVSSSVQTLKEEIERIKDIEVDRQRLIFRGRLLKNPDLLSSYGLEDDMTLHLVTRPQRSANDAAGTNGQGSASSGTPQQPQSTGADSLSGLASLLTLGPMARG